MQEFKPTPQRRQEDRFYSQTIDEALAQTPFPQLQKSGGGGGSDPEETPGEVDVTLADETRILEDAKTVLEASQRPLQ